jgi:hypothetical protein
VRCWRVERALRRELARHTPARDVRAMVNTLERRVLDDPGLRTEYERWLAQRETAR